MGWFSWLVGDDPVDEDFGYNEGTYIHLRSTKTPVQHWDAKVKYDHWGTPYVKGYGFRARYGNIVIRPKGKTDNWVYDVQWRHKSGPAVTFGKQPKDPFDDTFNN